jgi:hypothetical protein
MRCLKRNQRPFYYCLYKEEIPILDEYGNETGQTIVVYDEAVEMMANISQATGQSNTEQFGNLENYDKVIVTDDLNCPIDENSVLFIDKEPEWKDAEYNEQTAITVTGATVKVPVYDYTVRRVAKSLNSISIAVSKVKVS